MLYKQIPGTDINISVITLGTWVFSGDVWQGAREEDSLAAVKAALELGINAIDTAPIYGYGTAEKIVGKAIRGKRSDVILATKCGLIAKGKMIRNDLSSASIREEIDASLKRLDTDYIDIYQCHWPDARTPLEVTMEALLKLRDEKKIRHIGVSNFNVPLLKEALSFAPVVTLQNQYSLLDREIEPEILPFCKDSNVGVLAYGPLAGGILTGKYDEPPVFKGLDARNFFYKYYSGENFLRTQRLLKGLRALGKPLNEIAINWARQQEGVRSVLCGCRNERQARENIRAVSWDLTEEMLREINTQWQAYAQGNQ